MRRGVDEVREGDEGRGESDGGAVECRDKDLRVVRERVCDVVVVYYEGSGEVSSCGGAEAAAGAGGGYVCAAGDGGISYVLVDVGGKGDGEAHAEK